MLVVGEEALGEEMEITVLSLWTESLWLPLRKQRANTTAMDTNGKFFIVYFYGFKQTSNLQSFLSVFYFIQKYFSLKSLKREK